MEPPPSGWVLPDPAVVGQQAAGRDLLGVGADLAPGTLLAAYRSGLFPMEVRPGLLGWWSPDPRGVIPLDRFVVSRSLRSARRRFEVRVDTAFDAVVAGCADRGRPAGWITTDFATAYGELHRLGWAHSVEAWTPEGELVGGLYGVAVGGLFAGESMFFRRRDASKVALAALVGLLVADRHPDRLLDVQWVTGHLASLGAVPWPRERYLAALTRALRAPLPAAFQTP